MKYTIILILACSAVFIFQQFGATDLLVLNSSSVLQRSYTIITSMFAHANLLHLVFNMISLLIFGLILEGIIGSKKFILLYFSSGVVASIASILFYDSVLGASGAIFGIIGCLAVLRPRQMILAYGFPLPMIAAAVVFTVINLVGVFYPVSNTAYASHIAGLFIGLFFSFLFKGYREKRRNEKPLTEKELDRWEEEYMKRV